MEQKTKNYLKLGILLFGVYFLSVKCQPDTTFDVNKKINAKTVSFKEAKIFFKKRKPKLTYLKNSNSLTLTPDWNTLSQDELNYTDALLTKAETGVNKLGDFHSQLVFINIDNEIRSVIVTSWSSNNDSDNNLLDGLLFLNEYDGAFIDAYRIENGLFTKKIIPNEASVNQASVFSILSLAFAFQSNQELQPTNCWNFDVAAEFSDGDLPEIDLGALGSSSSGGFDEGFAQAPIGTTATNYGSYLNGAVIGVNISGSGGVRGFSNSGLGQVAVASLLNPVTGESLDAGELGRKKECRKINDVLQDYEISPTNSIQQMLVALKATTNQNHENAVIVYEDGASANIVGEDCTGGIKDFNSSSTSKIALMAHTHDLCGLDGNGTLSVFSMSDLSNLAELAYYQNIDNGTFVAFLATNDNTQYALTIPYPNRLIDLFYYDIINNSGATVSGSNWLKYTKSKTLSKKLNDEYFNPKEVDHKIKVDSTDPETDLLEFLNFMEEANMGIKLFEANATFNEFKEVKITNDTIVERKRKC